MPLAAESSLESWRTRWRFAGRRVCSCRCRADLVDAVGTGDNGSADFDTLPLKLALKLALLALLVRRSRGRILGRISTS